MGKENPLFNRFGFVILLPWTIYVSLDTWRHIPNGLSMLFGIYVIAFGYMGWIGQGWYNESELSRWFCQGCVAASLAMIAIIQLRAWRAKGRDLAKGDTA